MGGRRESLLPISSAEKVAMASSTLWPGPASSGGRADAGESERLRTGSESGVAFVQSKEWRSEMSSDTPSRRVSDVLTASDKLICPLTPYISLCSFRTDRSCAWWREWCSASTREMNDPQTRNSSATSFKTSFRCAIYERVKQVESTEYFSLPCSGAACIPKSMTLLSSAAGITVAPRRFARGCNAAGLVAAAYLAKCGRQVAVFEKRPIVGGAAVSESIVPGFTFSRCSYLAGLLRPKVIADLKLEASAAPCRLTRAEIWL
jgi:hypothetical protein